MSLLEIENLVARYGRITALAGISLHVDEGEIVTLIGANGAGKTTTLRAISGLVRASKGTIRFDGQDLAKLTPDRIVPLPDSALYMGFANVLGIAATGSRRAVYALPLLLGLDNLLGPATDGGLMQGCASAVSAMSGFGFAGLMQRGLSCVAAPAAGRRSGMRH